MSVKWLEGLHHHTDEPGRTMGMPDYAGQKGHWGYPVVGLLGEQGWTTRTHHLAIELAPHYIRVNTVAPAVVSTPI